MALTDTNRNHILTGTNQQSRYVSIARSQTRKRIFPSIFHFRSFSLKMLGIGPGPSTGKVCVLPWSYNKTLPVDGTPKVQLHKGLLVLA